MFENAYDETASRGFVLTSMRLEAPTLPAPELGKFVGKIRDQALHAQRHERFHFTEFVDGPNVNVQTVFPRQTQKLPGNNFFLNVDRFGTQPSCAFERVIGAFGAEDDAERGFRRQLSHTRENVIIERRNDRPIQIIVVADDKKNLELDAGRRVRVGFYFQAKIGVSAQAFQCFFQRQNTLAFEGFFAPLADIQFFQVLQGLARDRSSGACGARQTLIMKNDHVSVLSHLAIELDHIDAGFDGFYESQAGVFRI